MDAQKVVYIPEGFTGRLAGEPDGGRSFYAGGVHFCNIFIFTSGYRLSFSHCDPSIALEYIEKELRWVLEHECTEVKAWRCSHGDIDPPEYADVWQKLKAKIEAEDVSKKVSIKFSEKVMYETASISLADSEPKLHKIPNSEVAFPGAEPDLLRAVLKLNAYCTVNGDSFSPMRLLYEGGWRDLEKITEVTEDAKQMVTSNPYEVYKFADRWVKECGAEKNMATDGVKDVFGKKFLYLFTDRPSLLTSCFSRFMFRFSLFAFHVFTFHVSLFDFRFSLFASRISISHLTFHYLLFISILILFVAYIDIYRKAKGLSPLKMTKIGVNDQCPCKSGKKFKKCHFVHNPKYLQY
eukprot:Phypoly_transcript_09330.p1 GENE.Phypoly_transcript_09330~~Phypoly_transcript_09330.p1  ORF type:complete len:360 (+),score=31.71 Phypoly_transcript_09330:28-1080(+)